MTAPKRLRLGEILTHAGVISDSQLQMALAKQQLTREPIGEILVGLGFVTSSQISGALELQYGVRSVTLSSALNVDLARLLPASEIRRLRAVPVSIGQLSVAVVDLGGLPAIEELKTRFKGASIQPVVVSQSEFDELVAKLEAAGPDPEAAVRLRQGQQAERVVALSGQSLDPEATTAGTTPGVFRLPIDDRTDLRLLESRHADAIFALIERSRLHLREWLPWVDGTRSSADTLGFIKGALRDFAEGSAIHVGIWHRDRVVGVVGLSCLDPKTGCAQIGYWLGQEYQGAGLMTEACRALLAHAFGELGLNKVEIRCAPANRKSRAIPERLGFIQEGTLRGQERVGQRLEDHVVFGLLRSEWQVRSDQR